MKLLRALLSYGILAILASCTLTSQDSSASQDESTPVTTSQQAEEHATQGEIYIAVDQALRPLVQTQIETFMSRFPRATIHPIYLPGEEAIARMLQTDSIRLVLSTRRLTEGETGILRERLLTPDYAQIAYESLMVVGHPGLQLKNLTVEQLKGILTGKYSSWRELSPTAEDREIRLVFDHPQSSTLRYLRDSLLQGQPLRQDQVYSQQTTPDMLAYVSNTPGALGFGSWAWLSDVDNAYVDSMRSQLRIMRLETDTAHTDCRESLAFVGPYQSYIYQHCYPMTRSIVSIRRESIYGLGAGFIAYMVGPQGQRIIHKAGLVAEKTIPREVRFPAREDARSVNTPLP